jgi:patatin-like phospholipase/acyl hydrolase
MRLLDFLKNSKNRRRQKSERYILCIDGGGMRGVIAATLLKNIEKLMNLMGANDPLYSYFDLISGTSTGGIIALGLTTPLRENSLLANKTNFSNTAEIKNIVDIYLKYGSIIFPRNQLRFSLNTIGQLFTDKYDDLSFNKLLENIFKDAKLGEALRPTMVVTYDINNDRPYIISSYQNPSVAVKTAARATSAAPTFFSPTSIIDVATGKPISLIDGGVVANNPVLFAYKEAKKLYPDAEKFHVLSIGTASTSYKIDSFWAGSGVIGWLDPAKGTPIYRLYASSQMKTASEIASSIGDMNYLRIHKELDKRVRLDETDPLILAQMIENANSTYLEFENELKNYCSLLLSRPHNNFHPLLPVALENI